LSSVSTKTEGRKGQGKQIATLNYQSCKMQ
jgi:hypothetical protein